MKIEGRYIDDGTFITIFSRTRRAVYKILRGTGLCGVTRIGHTDEYGKVLSWDRFDEMEAEAYDVGVFHVRN